MVGLSRRMACAPEDGRQTGQADTGEDDMRRFVIVLVAGLLPWSGSVGAGDKERTVLKGHTGAVLRVVFSRDGKLLASAGWDDTVKLWDPDAGKEIASFQAHTGMVNV